MTCWVGTSNRQGAPTRVLVACLQDVPLLDLRDTLCALHSASQRQAIDERRLCGEVLP